MVNVPASGWEVIVTSIEPLPPFSIEEIEEPELKKLYLYWDALKGGREIPLRSDLDPFSLGPTLLPQIALFDVEHDPERIKLRLVGTSIVKWMGKDATGTYLDDPQYYPIAEQQLGIFLNTARMLRPNYVRSYIPDSNKEYLHYARILMPLVDAQGVCVMLLGGYALLPFPADATTDPV